MKIKPLFGWMEEGQLVETSHALTIQFQLNGNQSMELFMIKTNITLGADWTELAKHTSKLNVVNSFSQRLIS